ncbi:MAG: chorismate mutase [Alphaproteobacteria bacterium]|nr:chorismate mutase [Alphaproteobacteria bacterium]MBL6776086.1 chorismate mutase [Alphaproteobacteria bacterium]
MAMKEAGMEETLADLREQIDALDSQLCEVLAARLALSRKVSATKTGGAQVFRPAREAQMLGKLLSNAPSALKPLIPVLWRAIISSSIAEQRPDFTIAASAQMRDLATNFSAGQLQLVNYNTAEEAMQALADNQADIVLLSPAELLSLVSQLGPDKTAVVIARLPLVMPEGGHSKDAAADTSEDGWPLDGWPLDGWIIARPPFEKSDKDCGVFYHTDGNGIEVSALSSYEKRADVQMLGVCTAICP